MALGLLFQNTQSNINLGQSMLAGTQGGTALGQAFRQQDATMLAAQEAHRAERMAAFEMSVKAARAVGEAQDREFQRSQVELNNEVARSQIQFNKDQLQFRRDEFNARLPLDRRRVEADEGRLDLEGRRIKLLESEAEAEREAALRKSRQIDQLLSGDPNAPYADGSGVSPRSPSRSRTSLDLPQGGGGLDTTLLGGSDGGSGGASTTVRGNFDVAPDDISPHLSPQLAQYTQDFIEAGKKYGVDPRFLAAVSRLESHNGTSAAFRNKNNAMGIMAPDDDGVMQLVEFGSIADSIDAQARKLADENGPYAGRDTIAGIGAVYAPPGKNDRRGLNSGWPSNVAKFYNRMVQDSQPSNEEAATVDAPEREPDGTRPEDPRYNPQYLKDRPDLVRLPFREKAREEEAILIEAESLVEEKEAWLEEYEQLLNSQIEESRSLHKSLDLPDIPNRELLQERQKLAQEQIQLFKDKSTLRKERSRIEANLAASMPEFKVLPPAGREKASTLLRLRSQIDTMKEKFRAIPDKEKGVIVGEITKLRAKFGENIPYAVFQKSVVETLPDIMQNLFNEVGTISEGKREEYSKILPDIKNSAVLGEALFTALDTLLTNTANAVIDDAKLAQADVAELRRILGSEFDIGVTGLTHPKAIEEAEAQQATRDSQKGSNTPADGDIRVGKGPNGEDVRVRFDASTGMYVRIK